MLTKHKKTQRGNFRVRSILLIVQIIIPFGLYFALQQGLTGWAWLTAGVFTLSMAILVWLG